VPLHGAYGNETHIALSRFDYKKTKTIGHCSYICNLSNMLLRKISEIKYNAIDL